MMRKALRQVSYWIPLFIGLSVIVYLFSEEFKSMSFIDIHITWKMGIGVLGAILFILFRDILVSYRFCMFAGEKLSLGQAFRVHVLCEFTAAVTPASVGGGGAIFLFMHREGIPVGKSTAVMISCVFLDELFLTVCLPFALLFFPWNELFVGTSLLQSGISFVFFLVYFLVALWTGILYWALFRGPDKIKNLLLRLFSIRILRRWHNKMESFTDDLVISSQEMKGKPFSFWCKNFVLTVLSWSFRFLIVNALLFAFSDGADYLLTFFQQLVLWNVMTASPTPGGSGVGELLFKEYYAAFFSSANMIFLAIISWRVITYYIYLLAGTIIVPNWLKGVKRSISR